MEKLQKSTEEVKDATEVKREQAIFALQKGFISEPFSLSGFLISLAISSAVSIGSALLSSALTKRQRVTQGDRGGQEFQIQRAEQGTPLPEIYGADPGDGLGGGFVVAPIIAWLSRDANGNVARKHVTKSRLSGGKSFGRPKAADVETITYDLDVLLLWGKGRLVLKRLWAAADTIYRTYSGPVEYYEAEAGGNTKAGGAANVTDGLASGGSAVTIPQNGSLQWNGVEGDGTAAVLEFYYKSSVPISVEFTWVGGSGTTVFTDTLNATGGVYLMGYNSAAWILASGSVNTVKVKNLSATALVVDRLGVRVSGGPTGVPDPDIPVDDPYDPDAPHSPNAPYDRPLARFSSELLEDGDGTTVGTVQAGAYAGIAVYEGADDQLPDSVVEAAVDALYGEGSTPAYRGRATTRLSNFYLTRYQEVFPPMRGLLEHRELKTLADIFGHMCERVGLTSGEYDFSDLVSIDLRGFVVSPPYTPKEVMTALARIFNVYFYESDKIYGLRAESASTFSVADSELGWVDELPGDDAAVLPELAGEIPVETTVPRRVSIRYYDPVRNYEQNIQGEPRQITTGQREDILELHLVMTADEAREAAQRELYQEDVESVPHSFALSYEHIYRNPGDVVTVTRTEGYTHQIRITSIKPALGAVECEGIAVDTAVYTQPVDTSGGSIFEVAPVAIPGQVLAGFWDGPLLTDAENSINNGLGMYVWAVKRRGDGEFTGAALKLDRGLGYETLTTFDVEAVYGVTASTLTASTSVHDIVADALTVDLHTDDTLESYDRDDLWNGAGACIVGDEVCQILTATRDTSDLSAYPNRWNLVIGLRARRGTDFAVDTHATGERFVLVDDAVKFVAMNANEAGVEREYLMVAAGQSQDDAAVMTFTFRGSSARPLAPVNAKRSDNSLGDSLVEFSPRARMGHGIHTGLSGFGDRDIQKFEIEFTDSDFESLSPPFVVRHTLGDPQQAVLVTLDSGTLKPSFTGVTANSFTLTGSVVSRRGLALQQINESNNYAEATLLTPADGGVTLGLISTAKDWRTETPDFRILLSSGGGGDLLEVYDSATVIYTEDASAYAATGVKVKIEMIGSRLRFHKYDPTFGWTLLIESYSTVQFPAHVTGSVSVGSSGTGTIRDVMLTTYPDPKVVVTTEQKTHYGIGATLYAEIAELDRRAGRGYPAQVALEDSL